MNIFSLKVSGLAFAALLAAGAANLAGAPAQAQQPIVVEGATPAAVVGHADLNLAADAGVQRLQARIRAAAERLCVEPGTASVQVQVEARNCITATVAAAQPQVRQAIARQAGQRFAAATIAEPAY